MVKINQPIFASQGKDLRVEILGARESALRTGRYRLALAGIGFAIFFTILAVRLVILSASGTEPKSAKIMERSNLAVIAGRADIIDRNGVLLATNLKTPSLYADAQMILQKEEAAKSIGKVLSELSSTEILSKLRTRHRFIWLKRFLTPFQQEEIHRLGIPGIGFRYESRRVYPNASAASHVLGFTDVDGKGIAGIEKFFDNHLSWTKTPTGPLRLSIDLRVQHALYDELYRSLTGYEAQAGVGLVSDSESGEILALVSLPDFDPNHARIASGHSRMNRASLATYELGSVFKPLTVAMALDSGVVGLKDGYDAARPIKVSRHLIRDYHPKNRWLSVPEILIYSSNIGAAKMALDVGAEVQKKYFKNFGLLDKPKIELPEVGYRKLTRPWRDVNVMTSSFGHGIAVSPLQLVAAFGSLINGGIIYRPTLLWSDNKISSGTKVISELTSERMRRLLRLVVTDGTGRRADVPGFLVGGKTGTAEKIEKGKYKSGALLSSFIAAFPMTKPRYVVYVMLDAPKSTGSDSVGGGRVAAPLAGRVVARIGPLLGVHPVDRRSKKVERAMALKVITRGPELATY